MHISLSLSSPASFFRPNGPARILPALVLVLLALLCPQSAVNAQESAQPAVQVKKKVVFLPFNVSIPGDYAYLENGLSSVLAGRLAARAGIQPVTENKTGRLMMSYLQQGQFAAFKDLLDKQQADYLVLGSLDREDGSYLMTSYVFQADTGAAPVELSETLADIDQAMQAVDNLSWKISDTVFSKPKQLKSGSTIDKSDGMAGFHTTHPERSYKEGKFRSNEFGLGVNDRFELVTSRKSRRINEDVKDINVVDMDGDGIGEILLLAGDALLMYRNVQGAFTRTGSLELEDYLNYHTVTFGDFNNDGIQELFISGSNGNLPSSSIIQLQQGKFRVIQKNIPYYLHAVSHKGEQPRLFGQTGGAGVPHGGKIYELRLENPSPPTRVKEIVLPRGVSVYDFTVADISGDGLQETIVITPDNHIQVFSPENNHLYTSTETFGEGRNFFGTLNTTRELSSSKSPVYFKNRLVVSDVDLDGINDIVVGRNRAKNVRFFEKLRFFDGSTIMALSWKESKLTPLWETRDMAGYTVNYQVIPTAEEASDMQLVFCEASSSYPFAFWESRTAVIHTFHLKVKPEGEDKEQEQQ